LKADVSKRRERAYNRTARTAKRRAPTSSIALRMLMAIAAALTIAEGIRLVAVCVGVGVAVAVGAGVGVVVGASVGIGARVASGVGVGTGAPGSGGMISTVPVRSRVVLVILFAVMISGYLVPSP